MAALVILNRCHTFQIEVAMLTLSDDSDEIEFDNKNFTVDKTYAKEVWTRLLQEIASVRDFYLLQLLVRALANILILSKDYQNLIMDIKESNFLHKLIVALQELPTDVMHSKPTSFYRSLTLFIIHTFRLLIICQSYDINCLAQYT